MNCNEFIERIIDNDELDQIIADTETAEHLAQCLACRARLAFERHLKSEFAALLEQNPPTELTSKIMEIPKQLQPAAGKEQEKNSTAVLPHDDSGIAVATRLHSLWFKIGLSLAVLALLAVGLTSLNRYRFADKKVALKTDAGDGADTNYSLYVSESKLPPIKITQADEQKAEKSDYSDELATSVTDFNAASSAQQMFAAAPLPVPSKSQSSLLHENSSVPQVETQALNPQNNESAMSHPPVVIGKPLLAPKTAPSQSRRDISVKRRAVANDTDGAAQLLEQHLLASTSAGTASTGGLTVGSAAKADAAAPMSQYAISDNENAMSTAISSEKTAKRKTVLPVASHEKRRRVEEIMAAHESEIRAGTLDIDQWVLLGWITVKDRIEIAPPPGTKWMAVRREFSWKAELINVP